MATDTEESVIGTYGPLEVVTFRNRGGSVSYRVRGTSAADPSGWASVVTIRAGAVASLLTL